MANQGGPEQVGAVKIGVESDLSGLRQGLEQAKTEAAQKGQEIGKAVADGMNKGAAAGQGGGAGPGSLPPIDRKKLWGEIQADAAGMSTGDAVTAGAVAGATGAVVLPAVLQALQTATDGIKALVDSFAGLTKQQMELKDALERNAISLQAAAATMEKMFSSATGGNPNVSQDLPGKIARLDQKIAEIDEQRAEYTMRDVYDYTIGYPMHWFADTPTRRDQLAEQRDEFMAERTSLSEQMSGIRTREKMRGTIGGIARTVAIEQGMSVPDNFGSMGTVSFAEAQLLADLLRQNNTLLQEIVRASTQTYQQNQQRAADFLRGVDATQR